MKNLLLRTDCERRGLFLMEWTQSNEVLSAFLQPDVLGNDINDVIGGADFFNFFGGESHIRGWNLANNGRTSNNEIAIQQAYLFVQQSLAGR